MRSFTVVAALFVLATIVFAQDLKRSGFFGIAAAELSGPDGRQLPTGISGIVVKKVIDGGSAKDAGIQPNDIITQVGDHKIRDVRDFVETVGHFHEGDRATIVLRRSGQEIKMQLVVKPRPYEKAPDVETFYKAISVDGTLRRVIVTAPKTPGKHPTLLYVNGVGCFSQESIDLSSSDTKLLYGLTRSGFVTMRVEKSSMGDSEGLACMSPAVDFRAEVRGYVAGLKALKEFPFVDPNQVFIIGLSIGGVEAPLIAQQVPVKGLVVINTVAKPFLEYLMDTRRRQNFLRRVPFDEIDQRSRLNERCNHRLLIEGEMPEELLKKMPDCADFIAYPAPYTFMQQWAALNPAEEWKKVDAPVLVVYGTSDYISTIADDPYLVDLINSFHPGRATIKAIAHMDHYMLRAASMEESMTRTADMPVEFEPAVLEAIKGWLRDQLSLTAPARK